jgi:hypothetical protein
MSGEDEIKEIMKKLENHEHRILRLEGLPQKINKEIKKLSIKEFILEKKPSDDVQKTLVIGYYLEHFEDMESFNVQDITEGFRAARETVPSNVNDKVNSNIEKGYFMVAKEKKDKLKAWYLTNSGEKFVEKGLNTEGQ